MVSLVKAYLNLLYLCGRFFYWQLLWLRSKKGQGGFIELPLKIEGRGKLIVGSHFKFRKSVLIGIGKGACLRVGDYIRIYNNVKIKLGLGSQLVGGHNLVIEEYARIFVSGKWIFGDNVHIGSNCQIFSRESGFSGRLNLGNESQIGFNTLMDLSSDIIIGNNVSIGPNCTLYTHNHIYSDKSLPAWKGGVNALPIIIEDGAWIASGVIILPGVTIGRRSVIAAGSVVTHNLDAESVYGGVPARLIKKIL